MTVPWGGAETAEERAYFDPDPHRHCLPDQPCPHLADQDWRRTLAALDRDGGVAIYARAELEDEAWWDDWEPDEEER